MEAPSPRAPTAADGIAAPAQRRSSSGAAAPGPWRLCRPEGVRVQPWPQDYSVFNTETGDTHILSELPATAILALQQDGPMGAAQLAAHLAALCEVEPSDAWHRRIHGMLSELAALELIEQAPADIEPLRDFDPDQPSGASKD